MRQKIVAGNWKMNTSVNEGIVLYQNINSNFESDNKIKIIIAAPFTHLSELNKLNYQNIELAAQNCAYQKNGAFTGEVSALMVKSAGASYVLIGHSERRKHQNEDHLILKNKVEQAIEENLTPIFCCGEPLEDREANCQYKTIENQISESLFHLSEIDFGKIIVAYEPVWAIGTGKTATPSQAQDMHFFIRGLVEKKFGETISENLSILYGGSCNDKNAYDLFKEKDVDGGLIGGASLDVNSFISIIDSMKRNI